jgi:acetyl-CoA carboxylase biotin carboxylase subunit/propionyl-CoA carboxylase alpha chain
MAAQRPITNVLVANRGVPAVRIMHTCRDRKIRTTAVYSTPDRLAHHVYMADAAVHIGEAPPAESYLNMDRILDAARRAGADAVHAGWGFLAENAEFARRVIDAGLTWIGPPPEVIRRLGDKIEAKGIAVAAKVPVIPGVNDVRDADSVRRWMRAEKVAFPIMIKAAAGGGGRGMVKVEEDGQIPIALSQARSEAKKSFGSDTVLAEKYIERGRHIEVQIIADGHGNVVHLFERECTIQRRNQKVIEEAPSPTLDAALREEICSTAVRLMRSLGYASAGTVEFIFDSATRRFYFLEVNTRLQVEHGITELITGLDIVGLMLDVAAGKKLPFAQADIRPNRWALEVRLNAEDPRTFGPSFGSITRLLVPAGPNVRVTGGVYEGADVPPYYDSLLGLVITAGKDRADAIRVMDRCLGRNLRVEGVKTLQPLLLSIIRHPSFIAGDFSTRFIEEHLAELVASFPDRNAEDEVLKVARYVAEVSALGPRGWM